MAIIQEERYLPDIRIKFDFKRYIEFNNTATYERVHVIYLSSCNPKKIS